MRVGIVGGAGFIGCAVARALLQRGIEPCLLDSAARLARIADFEPTIPRKVFDFSVERYATRALGPADAIAHLGCTTDPARSMSSLAFDADSNIGPSLRLFEDAAQAGVQRIVFSSSGGTVYGVPRELPVKESAATNPLSGYGVSKLAIEKYLALFNQLRGISLRVANPYGAFQLRGAAVGVIARYVLAVSRQQPLEVWGDGTTTRDYIAIDDVAEAFVCALTSDALPSGAYNIGSGEGASLSRIIAAIFRAANRQVPVQYCPARPFDVPAVVLDSTLFNRLTGWKPQVSLDVGIAGLWVAANEQ